MAKKTTVRKRPAKKSTPAKKKPTTPRKAPAKKKPSAKKKPTTPRKAPSKKKPSTKKKPPAKKKPTTPRKAPSKKKPSTKKKSTTPRKTPAKKRSPAKKKVLVIHDNRIGYGTTKAHKLAEKIDKMKGFKSILDKHHWKPGEKTSPTETNKRERKMVKKADIVVRVVPPSSKTGEKRHEGGQSEVRKTIKASKPFIEIFERDARDSPNRSKQEKNYSKRIPVHLKSGEHLEKGFKKGIEELNKKKL